MTLKERLEIWGKGNGFGYYSPEIDNLADVADDHDLVIEWMAYHAIDRASREGVALEAAIQAGEDQIACNESGRGLWI